MCRYLLGFLIFVSGLVAGCATPSQPKSEGILVSVDIKDRSPNVNGTAVRRRLTTRVSLQPSVKTPLGGIVQDSRGTSEVYTIEAHPKDGVILFQLEKSGLPIGKMQILAKSGERGTIESQDYYQRIEILNSEAVSKR